MPRCDVHLHTLSLLRVDYPRAVVMKMCFQLQSDRSRLGLNADETENVPRGLAPAQVEKAQSPGSSGPGGADMLDGTCDVKLLFF